MKRSKIGSLLILTAVVYPTISTDAQVLFQEDFQDGNAASRWTVSQAGGDSTVDFAFDYSTAGIPMAPNGTGTIGLKMQANLGPIGASSGIVAFPDGQSFSTTAGSYTLLFDVWMNGQSTTGSTEFSIFGVGHTSTAAQQPTVVTPGSGPSDNGLDFAFTGENGAARDIRVFVSGTEQVGVGNIGGYARQELSFQQGGEELPYVDAYDGEKPWNQWLEIGVRVEANQAPWTVNGQPWATPPVQVAPGNIMLGYMDVWTSVAGADIFGVYDNVRIQKSGIVVDVNSGSLSQTQAGHALIEGTEKVRKTGLGTVIFDQANPLTGPMVIEEGTLQISHPEAVAFSSITISPNATMLVSPGVAMTTTSVALEGGSLVLPTESVASVNTARLAIDQDLAGSQINLGIGRIEVAAGGIAEADVLQAIIAGRIGGGWDGIDGIMSSAAGPESNRAVGYRVLDSGETIISWAAYGDINLDGKVSSSDINLIINEGLYGTTQPATWASGDFNYDGRVDVLDMTLLTGTGLFGTGSYLPTGPAPTAAGQSLTTAAVPEPGFGVAALAGLSIAVGMLRARLRRSCLHAAAA